MEPGWTRGDTFNSLLPPFPIFHFFLSIPTIRHELHMWPITTTWLSTRRNLQSNSRFYTPIPRKIPNLGQMPGDDLTPLSFPE
jgi:hypothetical protein